MIKILLFVLIFAAGSVFTIAYDIGYFDKQCEPEFIESDLAKYYIEVINGSKFNAVEAKQIGQYIHFKDEHNNLYMTHKAHIVIMRERLETNE